ncbi:MAG TPA: DUF3617 family protein [Allosphingosinicella sp.]
MRAFALVPLLLAAACSGGSEAPKQEETAAAQKLDAGQWELTTEVTKFAKADQGKPKIDTPEGTKETRTVCVEEADAAKPQPAMFGGEKDECTYGDFYMSDGRLSATVNCNRPGLSGNVATRADVDFKAKSLEGTLSTTTYLTTDGDVQISRKLTGRHTGQCTAEPAGKEKKA